MAIDDKAIGVCPVSPDDARELGREMRFTPEDGHVYMYAGLPSNGLVPVPFRSQLYKAFNTTFKLMVFLLEKKKIKTSIYNLEWT